MARNFVDEYPGHTAARHPDRSALIQADELVTYAQLELRTSRFAAGLRRSGVRPGERIAWLGHNCIEYVELLLGTAACGAVTVPLNWRLAPPELLSVLDEASPVLVFCSPEFTSVVKQLHSSESTYRVISIGDEYTAWLDACEPSAAPPPAQTSYTRTAEDCFLQLYTGGTTGRPKGVCLNHRAILARRAQEAGLAFYSWDDPETVLLGAPMFHIGGTGNLLQALHHGATCVIQDGLDPDAIQQAVARYGIRRLFSPPVVLRRLIDRQQEQPLDLSSLRLFTCGSAPIPPTTLRDALLALPSCGFVHAYGMTEMAGAQVMMGPADLDPHNEQRLLSCGRAMPGVELRVVNPQGEALASGAVGEVELRSEARMSGYWQQPEQTAEAFRNGWYRTGDAGQLDDQGFLYIVDRIKDMIISGGENIYPGEVENALHEHPAIALAAVIGRPHAQWGESPHAFIVLRQDASVAPEALIQFLRSHIAGYKIPRTYDFVPHLPLTSSGKISKVELRKLYWANEARGVH